MILVLLISVFSILTDSHLPELKKVRTLFYESVESESKTKELYQLLNNDQAKKEAIFLGYFGATQALFAKHSWNPYHKLDYLYKSMNTLEKAIQLTPEDLEIRFLRFSIQHYLPSFLGKSKNLEEDRDVIIKQLGIKHYHPEDTLLVKNVAAFLLESKRCNARQQKFLKINF